MYKLGLEKVQRETKDQTANICWIIEKAKELQKNINLCFIDYSKAFDCLNHNKLWKILKEMGVPDHLTCLLRNLMQVKRQQLQPDMKQMIGSNWEGVWQGCILSPCLLHLYTEYIMWNASLDESQAGIKTARRNTNNLSYADDATLMAEGEEELKSFLMKVKEKSENAGLKLNIQKNKIMTSSLNTWNREVKSGSNDRFYWTDTQFRQVWLDGG